MEANEVKRWVERYVRAWETNEPDDIGGLFTDDARYYTRPTRPPWNGRDGILQGWLEARDEPGTWHFRSEVIAVCDEVAFVRGRTSYPDKAYANLWVVRFGPDGRCEEFTEWWMKEG